MSSVLRISPPRSFCSKRIAFMLARAAYSPAVRPAGPPPMMMRSKSVTGILSRKPSQTRTHDRRRKIPRARRLVHNRHGDVTRSFPAVLVGLWREAGRGVALTNPAVNGYATDDLIAEELPLVAQVRPTLVTVLIGANDIVRAVGADGYRERLARIYAHLRAHAPRARVVALPQPDWSMSPAAVGFGDVAAIAREIERFNEIARAEGERSG